MARIDTTANRIKKAMKLRGIKAVDLSKATGISKSTISCYLTERRHPTDENIYKISHALMVDEAWLIGFGGEEEASTTKGVLTEMVNKMNDDQIKKTIKFIEEYIL